jgi:glycosyltransferase involved in cell wall biosynthesis
MPRALIIIPAHNEVASIEQVIKDLRHEIPTADRLVVNDGSVDGTGELVASLGERCLQLACNVGYGPALQVGLSYARRRGYDVAVFVDGDGQHCAQDVPRMTAALEEWGCDVVIGSRYGRDRQYTGALSRRIGQRLFSYVTRLVIGQRIYDTTSGLKAVRATAFRVLLEGAYLDFHTEALVQLAMRGYDVRELQVSMRERQHGRSMHSWRSVLEYPLKTMLLTAAGAANVFLTRRQR